MDSMVDFVPTMFESASNGKPSKQVRYFLHETIPPDIVLRISQDGMGELFIAGSTPSTDLDQ